MDVRFLRELGPCPVAPHQEWSRHCALAQVHFDKIARCCPSMSLERKTVLTMYPDRTEIPGRTPGPGAERQASFWIDLVDPSKDERTLVEALHGLRLPSREEISAIELSNRLRSDGELLRLNIPGYVREESGRGVQTPLGFVLTPSCLITLRYADSSAFERLKHEMAGGGTSPRDGAEAFVAIIEAIVGVSADDMEAAALRLSQLARKVFTDQRARMPLLREALFQVGDLQRQITQIRSTMLDISRVVGYAHDSASERFMPPLRNRLKTTLGDIASLNEFDQQMDDRVQFLLDAVLGFINNDQNDAMKVLTVVSVATIPPIVLAGIWGMNFKSIPEYNWPHGYAFALTLMVISVIVPLVLFKRKGWF